jgi:hypothetical protein
MASSDWALSTTCPDLSGGAMPVMGNDAEWLDRTRGL